MFYSLCTWRWPIKHAATCSRDTDNPPASYQLWFLEHKKRKILLFLRKKIRIKSTRYEPPPKGLQLSQKTAHSLFLTTVHVSGHFASRFWSQQCLLELVRPLVERYKRLRHPPPPKIPISCTLTYDYCLLSLQYQEKQSHLLVNRNSKRLSLTTWKTTLK